ncbi:MAG: TetR/AcrR family transcriptional regulator [Solirubrobacteraceae bacterium]
MVHIATRDGYAAATIAQVIAHARVSRPTFYEYFADKDDCFLAAHRDISEGLLTRIRRAVADASPERALQSVVSVLMDFAGTEPVQARFLLCETVAGGPRALDARDGLVAEIEQIVERARAGVAAKSASPDLPPSAVIGAIHWLLPPRLRRCAENDFAELNDELTRWVESYGRPAEEHRWRTLAPGPLPAPSRYISELPGSAPTPLPPGRSSRSGEEVARNQRERILYATAEVAARKGYTAATIAEITSAARVDPRLFYSHFPGKQEAFLAAHELGFQHTMAVAASAFFSTADWPERMWQGVLAGSHFQATHPTITHVVYVQSYAVGPLAEERIDDIRAAFTMFLREGNEHGSQPQSLTAMEAIVAAGFEIAYQFSRSGRGDQLPCLAYHITYLCLAPFLGPEAADRFIDEKIGASRRQEADR